MQQYYAPRIAFYSHDTMGLGHIRRNMLLAQAVLNVLPEAVILLITGVKEAGNFIVPNNVDLVTLPTYIKTSDGKYRPRSLGKDIKRLVSIRSNIIRATLDAFEPDIFIADNVPRGAMSELDLSLPLLKAKKTHLVLGLRDIIDDPQSVLRQWAKLDNANTIRNYFSSIWVYGDQHFYDLTKSYELDEDIKQKIIFVGFLDAVQRLRSPRIPSDILPGIIRPYSLCVVGGGQDGFMLASTFAKSLLPTGTMGVLVTGSMMSSAEKEILHQIINQRSDMIITDFIAEPLELLRQARNIVSMGGYNTTTEILSFHQRALIVPRVMPRQEQWIRASRLAELELVTCIHPKHLTVEILSDWLHGTNMPPDPRKILDFNGLDNVAKHIKALFNSGNIKNTKQLEKVE